MCFSSGYQFCRSMNGLKKVSSCLAEDDDMNHRETILIAALELLTELDERNAAC